MKITRIHIYLFTIITILVIIGLWATGYLGMLSPVTWSWLALAGYAFPLFLVATVMLMALWVFFKQWKLVMMTVIGLIVAYYPVSLYCPLNPSQELPADDVIQVMSFNTEYWGKDYFGDQDRQDAHKELIAYIAQCAPDVACLQESEFNSNDIMHVIDSIIRPKYPFIDTAHCKSSAQMTIFSRYPIVKKERIDYESQGNGSAAFWVDVKGKQVIFVNNHLQTMGLSIEDREKFSDMVHGNQERDTMKTTSHTILGKILDASRIRAPQAEAVARFIRMHKGSRMIVCGDFNDIPQSYVHHTIADDLTDCYRTTAMGPGYTFSRYGMRVRIDNMLCSNNLIPYNCFVDNSISLSDHYPIRCWFTLK